jgi:hypothetical protein
MLPPTLPAYAETVLNTADLVSYWPLDEMGGTRAWDLARTHRSGTYTASPTLGAPGPFQDGAAKFNGSSQYVTVPDDNAFTLTTTGQLTIEAWVKPTASTSGCIVAKGTSSNWEWRLICNTSANATANIWTLSAGNDRITLSAASGSVPVGVWSYVALTIVDSVLAAIYANNKAAVTTSSFSSTSANGTSPLNIGRRPDNSQFINATVAHVAIYSRALSAGEVRDHHAVGRNSR